MKRTVVEYDLGFMIIFAPCFPSILLSQVKILIGLLKSEGGGNEEHLKNS